MTAAIIAPAAGAQDPRFGAAYHALRQDSSIQLAFTPAPPVAKAPDWLRTLGHWVIDLFRPIGRFLQWITSLMPDAPYARILLWGVILVAIAALLWLLVRRVRNGRWWLRRRSAGPAAESVADEWVPDAEPVRQWLDEADRLAARGDYAEAVHHLLRRSVEDIARRRPQLFRPALTSRDLAAADAIPAHARTLFAGIAAIVERSLFGGRAVNRDEWDDARAAYADFALAKAWRA